MNDSNSKKIENLLGVHALVWVGGWSHTQCEEAIKNTAEAGFGLIEIPALDPSRIDALHTKSILNNYGIKAACSLGLSFDADINNESEEIVERGYKRLLDALSVVEALEGDYLGGVLFSALGRYKLPPSKLERENSIKSIRKLAKEAQKRGITLGLEPVNRYESNLINTAEQALDFINEVGEPNVTVHLDVYHMNIEENDLVSPVIKCGEKLGYVHIGASHRGGLGDGNIDFDSFFRALSSINYRETITFESFSSEIVDPELSSTLAIWRNLWTDNKKMASEARKFIQNKINENIN